MSPVEITLDSDALRANTDRSPQPVVIPRKYLPLIEAVDSYVGVKAPLGETLGEYFHAYRNVDLLIDGFQIILLRNWDYFERSDNRTKVFSLLAELVTDLLEDDLPDPQASLLLRQLLTWCTTALSGPHADEYDKPLLKVAACLGRFIPKQTLPALERDNLLRNLLRAAARRPRLAPVYTDLYRGLLAAGYERVVQRLPLPVWALSEEAELTDREAVASSFSALQPNRVNALIAKSRQAALDQLLSVESPTFSNMIDEAIDHCKTAISLGYHHVDSYNTLGNALAIKGRFREAAQVFQAALQFDPNNEMVRDNLRMAMERMKQTGH